MRRDHNGHGLNAFRVVGGLLPPEFLQSIAALGAKRQSGADYGLSKSLVLKDEIARYWRIANDLYAAYVEQRARADLDAEDVGIQGWLFSLFGDVLGYTDLSSTTAIVEGDRWFPITHSAFGGAVPILFTVHDVDLDRTDVRFGQDGRRRAAYGVMQELLNAGDLSLWGVMSNGLTLRLLRDNASLTRPAYIEADLRRIFEEQLYSDFAALWLTLHASRLQPLDGKPAGCILEAWRSQAQETGLRALEHLREGVTTALQALGSGFLQHPQNDRLRIELADGTLSTDAYFQELLRLVYRLLFLFTAEERHLLHGPHATDEQRVIYGDGYALARLRERALRRRHYDRHADLWVGLRIVFQSLDVGAPPLALPALGGLFASDQCATLDAVLISNERLLEAIRALGYFRSGGALVRVNYRDMGTEELGSVYESLLELQPYLDVDSQPWTFGFVGQNGERTKGSARKTSGSYYTPASLVNELIKSALEPVMAQTVAAHSDDPRRALLDLRIVDPACGSGHFLLAASRRIAVEIARLGSGADTPDEAARQHALREVVQHCIFGVDLNPLAVELCKAALWIETVEPGKPLTFLDPHIRCGDSLVGILDPQIISMGIPDDAYQPLVGDDKAICRDLKRRNHRAGDSVQGNLFDQAGLESVSVDEAALDAMPEDTLAEVRVKQQTWEGARQNPRRRREELRADLFVSAFFARKTPETIDLVPLTEDLNRLHGGMAMRPDIEKFVTQLAKRHGFFHWHVAFAEIMQRGGFDVVLGNPPWERVKLQEKEFFAQRSAEIATAPNKAARDRLISALVKPSSSPSDRALHRAFEEAKHEAEAASHFIRSSGHFTLTGVGDVNTYAVFAEVFLNLIGEFGRAGLIVPAGIATDATTSHFFRATVESGKLARLISFENEDFIFPAVHHAYRFCLLTLGDARDAAAEFSFFLRTPEQIRDNRRRFNLTPSDLALLNPLTRTAPVFRSRADADLTKRIYARVPVLTDGSKGRDGNPWGIEFRAMFHMSNDSALFRTARQLESAGAVRDRSRWTDPSGETWLPLYEAKIIHQFDHRWGSYDLDGDEISDMTEAEKRDSNLEPLPRYWVTQGGVEDRLRSTGWRYRWLMGWRDVTGVEKVRTVIACAFPRVGVSGKLPLLFVAVDPKLALALLANLDSMPLDYIARQKVGGTSLSYFYLKQLPFIPAKAYTGAELLFISSRALELSYTSEAMRPLARDLGYAGPPFAWDPDRRAWLRAELDACYARLYGLSRDELRYILDPTDVCGADYPSETFRVLKEREIKELGEYRTARLVLDAYDRIERDA